MDDDEKKFLEELTALTLKYRLKIGGCGCCGSPYLSTIEEAELMCLYSVDETWCNLNFGR